MSFREPAVPDVPASLSGRVESGVSASLGALEGPADGVGSVGRHALTSRHLRSEEWPAPTWRRSGTDSTDSTGNDEPAAGNSQGGTHSAGNRDRPRPPEPIPHPRSPTAGSSAQPPPSARGPAVLLIGGDGAIGTAVAGRLSDVGARVALQHQGSTKQARQWAAARPGRGHLVLEADPADAAEVAELIDAAVRGMGGLDAVVVTQAAAPSVNLVGCSVEEWTDTWANALSTHLLAVAVAAHAAGRSFLARLRAGRIVLVIVSAGSEATRGGGHILGDTLGPAIRALGDALSRELAPHGISVTTISVTTTPERDAHLEALAETVGAFACGATAATLGVQIQA